MKAAVPGDLYPSIRRFVDRDLKRHGARPFSLFIAIVPLLVAALLAGHLGRSASFLLWAACIAVSAGWTIFVGWRALLLLLKASVRADEAYDAHTKYLLPPEYRDTESATSARRKRRRSSMPGKDRP